MNQNRQPKGIPVGGQFAATSHDESAVALTELPCESPNAEATIGGELQPIAIAQARRDLTEGTRVQVVYLRGQAGDDEDAEPILRVVDKQAASEMITKGEGAEHGSHLRWAKQKAERDAAGNIVISDEWGSPYVAYMPLTDGSPGIPSDRLNIDVPTVEDEKLAKTTNDPAELGRLATSSNGAARYNVARNPHTTEDTLKVLAVDPEQRIRCEVADNPSTGDGALNRLAQDGDNEVRYRAARHPNISAQTLDRLSDDDTATVRIAVAQHANTYPETLLRMSGESQPGWDIHSAIAQNPRTPAVALERLARTNGFAKTNVAGNPNTPPKLVSELSHDTSTGNSTRAQAATNPALPEEDLFRLAQEDDKWVRRHAAQNPKLMDSPRVIGRLAGDPEPDVRRALAGNRHVAPNILKGYAYDPDSFVRASAAMNPNLPPDALSMLADDDRASVRARVARNPSTPRPLLERLAQEDGAVGIHAQQTLAAEDVE